MKKILLFLVLVLFVSGSAFALDRAELKKALKDLTIDDLREINDSNSDKVIATAVDTGYVQGSVMGGGGGYIYFIPTSVVKVPAGIPTSTNPEVPALGGGGGGFVVNVARNWAWGVNFGGFGGGTGKMAVASEFESFDVGAMYAIPYLKWRPVVQPSFIIDVNAGIGYMYGGFTYSYVDETGTNPSYDAVRSGSTYPVMLEISARYRILPVWHVGVTLGVMNAVMNDLKRGDFTDASSSLNLSGSYLSVTMGGNF